MLRAAILLAALHSFQAVAQESNAPVAAMSAGLDSTNWQDGLNAIYRLEGQLKTNQMALEQNRREAREAAARSAEVLSNGLQTMQATFSEEAQALAEQNGREIQVLQGSTRSLLLVGGIFAGVASIALLLVAYFQYRMSRLWAELTDITGGVPALPAPGSSTGVLQLSSGGASPGADSANLRVARALEQLESRVNDLERSATTAVQGRSGELGSETNGEHRSGLPRVETGSQEHLSALLSQGQSRARQNDWDGALRCFEKAVSLDPNNGEALVRKGAALEHLRRLNEAFECYDRAIASNNFLTSAYLHKGGLCSRLERFKEALECYEKALKTHDA